MNDKPQRLFYFLAAVSEASRKHGVVITAHADGPPTLEFIDNPDGLYCLNPNNDGPDFQWKQKQDRLDRQVHIGKLEAVLNGCTQ